MGEPYNTRLLKKGKIKKGWNKMRRYAHKELKEILELHKKWLNSEAGGVRADLSNTDLSYSNLSNACLRNSNLSNSNLSNADLTNADLSYSNLSYSNLSSACLRNSNLHNSDLSNADLSYANLSYSNLIHSNLNCADLRSANLSYAIGEMKYVKSLQFEKYYISYTATELNIGCQSHSIEKWRSFDDKTISKMDKGALEWWQKWKPILMNIIEVSPALECNKLLKDI